VVQNVVFWWSDCGVLRGKRGGLAVTFLVPKNRHLFQLYFSDRSGLAGLDPLVEEAGFVFDVWIG
jgi:hypothetical protein